MKKVIITGGTGFLGLSFAEHMQNSGFKPILVARNKPKNINKFELHLWDGINLGKWADVFQDAYAVVNLAGKSVDCKKTPDNCDLILRSRLDSTKVVGEALKLIPNSPKIWIQMSTAHIYGDSPTSICTESSFTGYGLAPFVGKAWEETMLNYLPQNVREVRLRTSFVIGKNGGALNKLVQLAKLGLGGKAGSGKQGFSWIHEFDMNEIIHKAIINENYNGVYIASSPNPVSNQEFMKAIRKKIKMPIGIPASEFMVRFGAKFLLNTDPELALFGRYVKSERLEKEGYEFKYPELEKALDNLII